MEDNLKELEHQQTLMQLCRDIIENKKRDTKLLFIALVISLCLNVAIVGSFLYYVAHIEYTDTETVTTTTTYQQDTDGDNSDIVNGNQYNDSAVHNDGGQ